jgi:hypothetical protein
MGMTKTQAGKLGGQAWSLAKANASRVNGALGAAGGKLGGRPHKRPLAQWLWRSATDEHAARMRSKFFKLPKKAQRKLLKYFWPWAWEATEWEKAYVDFRGTPKGRAPRQTAGVRAALRELLRLAKQAQ